MIEAPQKFVVRHDCEKAGWQNGFRRILGEDAVWAAFGSTSADGTRAPPSPSRSPRLSPALEQ
jgi:hypothetical protein